VDDATAQSVAAGWEDIKAHEKQRAHVLDGVPLALPALARADKVVGRLERSGAPAPSVPGPTPADAIGSELLDVVRRARAQGVDPEAALRDVVRGLEASAREGAVTP
jgi:XTP/dITP diphosphohydrolase